MLMINNEEFLTPKNKRCGTQKDAERLRKVFRRYGFEVIEQNDLSSKVKSDKVQGSMESTC